MSADIVLATTAELDSQLVRDVVAERAAMEMVRDWLGDYFDASASVRSWTPYWKEIVLRRPGNAVISIRFRLGGPVAVNQSYGWDLSKNEAAACERSLIYFLDELGRAMCQQRVADAVQSQYAGTSRHVRNDDTILLQFLAPPATAGLGEKPAGSVETALFIKPNQTIEVYAHCADEIVGRATVRRLLANLQVAGIPLRNVDPVIERR